MPDIPDSVHGAGDFCKKCDARKLAAESQNVYTMGEVWGERGLPCTEKLPKMTTPQIERIMDMIFCVEDDDGIRNMMVYTLNAAGMQAEGFPDGKSFFEAVKTSLPSLVILDIMLPGEDGLAILHRLREKSHTASLPVIMATAKGTEYDKVLGLDSGADDYLVKPFGMMEMVSRVKAVLRRTAPVQQKLTLGVLTLDLQKYIALAAGQRLSLTLKEFELLRIFMQNPGQVFSRDQLLSNVWEADYVGETRTVDVHIGTLRTKLGQYGEWIETVRGVGYRLEEKA